MTWNSAIILNYQSSLLLAKNVLDGKTYIVLCQTIISWSVQNLNPTKLKVCWHRVMLCSLLHLIEPSVILCNLVPSVGHGKAWHLGNLTLADYITLIIYERHMWSDSFGIWVNIPVHRNDQIKMLQANGTQARKNSYITLTLLLFGGSIYMW